MSLDESYIEQSVCHYARKKGCLAIKFTGLKGFPDRIILYRGRVLWIEFKRTGEKPRRLQVHQIKRLREQGFQVEVIDEIETGKQTIDKFMNANQVENKTEELYNRFISEMSRAGIIINYKYSRDPFCCNKSWNQLHSEIQEAFRNMVKYEEKNNVEI